MDVKLARSSLLLPSEDVASLWHWENFSLQRQSLLGRVILQAPYTPRRQANSYSPENAKNPSLDRMWDSCLPPSRSYTNSMSPPLGAVQIYWSSI